MTSAAPPVQHAGVLGATLGHYRLETPLGSGGMGSVYLARDLALGRMAAVKVVGDAFEPSLRQRLLREAEASARLQHPAIATFYESGEDDGHAFIAMEYVRGRTLRDRIRTGALPTVEAVRIASTVLEALNHAHAAGILHRDIKPENIMLGEDGAAKLLDFGLAQVALRETDDPATVTNLTDGGILGTFGYMPPEQLRGDAVDARGDIFALGAVLYEMLTGRPAFPGGNAAERIAAILGREPDPLGPLVPAALAALVSRALSRTPDDRFAGASEMLSALRAASAGEATVALPQTLAVVDLRNLSGQSEHDWVGSGIAESLTIDLARVPGLTVVSRDRVLRTTRQASVDGHAPDALEIGRLLGCRWTISGSFQCMGRVVRITTTMTEVATGTISAAEKLDGTLDGIFELQDRLSKTVAGRLDLKLPSGAGPVDPDVEAFELHARGRRLWLRLEKGTFDQAAELFRRAIEIDPAYAPALSSLAALHAMRFTFTTDPTELETAADYAQRAIAVDPKLADPYVWLGYALMRQDRMDDALAAEMRAAALEPDLAFGHYFAGTVEVFRQRYDAAIPHLQKAVTLDPMHGFAWLGLGGAHLGAGNFQEARWCVERAVALEGQPGAAATAGASVLLGECLRIAGDLPAARDACLRGIEAAERSDHMYRDSYRGVGLCVLARTALDQGDEPAARAALQQLLAHIAGRPRTLGGGHLVVQAMAGLARAGEGAAWFDQACQLFTRRDRYNFSLMWTCSNDVTLLELARAARALHRPEADALMTRALDAGAVEARRLRLSS